MTLRKNKGGVGPTQKSRRVDLSLKPLLVYSLFRRKQHRLAAGVSAMSRVPVVLPPERCRHLYYDPSDVMSAGIDDGTA